MSKYIEEGYCIQEGIPTPDKPIEIKTKVIGKNLLETVEYAQQKEIERLHSIIKEATEYIENSMSGSWSLNEEYEVVSMNKKQILSILRGENKEWVKKKKIYYMIL